MRNTIGVNNDHHHLCKGTLPTTDEATVAECGWEPAAVEMRTINIKALETLGSFMQMGWVLPLSLCKVGALWF